MDTRELDLNLAHFKPDLWGNVFTSFSLDMELLESYTKEVEKLKKEVKEELAAVGVEVLEKMNLINTLERLGVSYLFTKEIEEQLDHIYTNYEEMNIDYDLCNTAVHFRIFRQHGYNVSCGVFNKFKDNSGTFKERMKILNKGNGKWLFKRNGFKWDCQAVDQLPKYLKPVFREIFSCYDELEMELEKKGTSYALPYFKKAVKIGLLTLATVLYLSFQLLSQRFQVKEYVGSYGEESEWIKKRYVPSFDEYIACRLKSSSRGLVRVAFIGLGELVTPQAFEWMNTDNQMLTASAIIGRISNDIVGYKFEQQREHVPTAVECYMKQHNVTEQEAIDELNKMVEKEWFSINEEMLRTTGICKNLLMTIVDTTRTYTEFYKTYDGFTEPKALEDHVKSFFVDPIPL